MGTEWRGDEEAYLTFVNMKEGLTTPVLGYPDPEKPRILNTGTSDVCVGSMFSQVQGGEE